MCYAGKLDSIIGLFSFIITPFRTLGMSFSARDIEMLSRERCPSGTELSHSHETEKLSIFSQERTKH